MRMYHICRYFLNEFRFSRRLDLQPDSQKSAFGELDKRLMS